MFNLSFRVAFFKIAGFVGSPLPSGNNVGNAIVAKYGVTYSFNGLLPKVGQFICPW